ncbi:MAG: ParB/RepB/Spo0J family partition protein, partial [Rhodoferax sp.]|nr:ParB/RepB/Spo0J family partition protein [Rhodoferax sp.]
MKTFDILPLAAIVPSLTNPRKHFDAIKLMELAESIRASGVHQPILVRPLPGNRVADTDRGITHEVIAGERRYRASLQAGAQTIPAMICAMDDAQVMEVQLVENLARDDLSALEEAEGYSALMDSSGQDVSAIATKIGKSRSYVFGRLKLLDLGVECKEALRTGAIDASRALLIARIPDTALQTKALAEAT